MANAQELPEIFTPSFVKALVCEFVATVIFIFIGLGAAFKWPLELPGVFQISFAFGLVIATLIQAFGHISGAHVNPAVTIAFFIGNQISLFHLLFYVVFQLLGAIVGAGMIYSVTPSNVRGTLALNDLAYDISPGEALVVEIILTFSVVLCIFSATDKRRTDTRDNPALSIGMAVTMAHLVGVFWIGPIIGASLASVIYNYVLYPHKLTMDERMDIMKGLSNPEHRQRAPSEHRQRVPLEHRQRAPSEAMISPKPI